MLNRKETIIKMRKNIDLYFDESSIWTKILKMKLERIEESNVSLTRLLDHYKKQMTDLENAFIEVERSLKDGNNISVLKTRIEIMYNDNLKLLKYIEEVENEILDSIQDLKIKIEFEIRI